MTLDEIAEALLDDTPALAEKARDYIRKRYITGQPYNVATSILGQYARYNKLTPRQWTALARIVAHVDVADEESSPEDGPSDLDPAE